MTASNLRNIVFVIRQSAQICSTSSRGRNNFPQFWADFSSTGWRCGGSLFVKKIDWLSSAPPEKPSTAPL